MLSLGLISLPYCVLHPMLYESWGFPVWFMGRGTAYSCCPWALNTGTSNPFGWFFSLSLGFPGGSVVKNLSGNAGNMDSILGSERSPGGGNDNPFQYSCLGNPMDRGVAKSQTRLSNWTHSCREKLTGTEPGAGQHLRDWGPLQFIFHLTKHHTSELPGFISPRNQP